MCNSSFKSDIALLYYTNQIYPHRILIRHLALKIDTRIPSSPLIIQISSWVNLILMMVHMQLFS